VKAEAEIGGKKVVRFGALIDPVKAALAGIPNPPPEMTTELALGVVEQPAFTLKMTANPDSIAKGKAGKVIFEATREKGADGDIGLAPLFGAPNLSPAATKGIPKGSNKTEVALTVAGNAPAGELPLVFRATTKVGGKDYAVIPPPLVIDVPEPKKADPKKDDKKEKKDKK
jgi:hypothetical protein